jgi:uncharacterized protein YggE
MSEDATINATGEATIPVSCDVAWLSLVIVTEGKTATDAATASAARITLVLDSIRETEPLLPELVTEGERTLEPMFDEDRLVGYRLHRVMRAQMPPEAAGVLLDVAIMAGAAPGSGIVWGVRDPTFARGRVTEAALSVARANAQAVAHVVGHELLELRSAEVECEIPSESTGLIEAVARARVCFAHRPR